MSVQGRWRLFSLLTLGVAATAMASSVRTMAEDPATQAPAIEPAVAEAALPAVRAEHAKFFNDEVLPILANKCFKCHGLEDELRGELNLTTSAGILAGGESGPAIDLASPEESMLLSAINYDAYEMPPTGQLPAKQIEILTRWIKLGAPYTPEAEKVVAASKHHGPPRVTPENMRFWSFQPVKRPDVPVVHKVDWVKNPIDAFILQRLEEKGLSPNPAASKLALIRRAYYDLTGLPPTPNQVQEFLADESPDAYAKLVDRLLESPHYGEKWGRHWLDLVHYAESNSFERDNPKPEVWRYRDYVIRSFNADKPYNQFLQEQLAGDELEQVTPDSIVATGYYRLGLWDDESADPPQSRYDELDDWVTITSQVMLGLTMNCARCHDHKLDPIPHEDYYRLLAFFRDIRSFQGGEDGMRKGFSPQNFHRKLAEMLPPEQRQANADTVAFDETKLQQTEEETKRLQQEITEQLPGGVRDDFQYELNQLIIAKQHRGQSIPADLADRFVAAYKSREELRQLKSLSDAHVLCILTRNDPAPTTVMARGNPHSPDREVQPGFPQVLGFDDPTITPPPKRNSTGRRLALAQWVTSEKNPLTARVIANRLWQHHFGRGIVRSTSDFGLAGEPPTHPELLDWLASELVAGGWKLKSLHRQIMNSNAYRMSSELNAESYAKDPRNDLFWRFDMRRLTAEEIRDSILTINNTISREMYGPSIYTDIPREVLAGQSNPGANWRPSKPELQTRRSIYIHVKRSLIEPFLEQFDAADVDNTCPVRFTTTLPTQALGMLNSEFMNKQADLFAKRIEAEAGPKIEDRIALGFSLVTQRAPTQEDLDRGAELFQKLQAEHAASDHDALKYVCLVLLNLNEFVYLD